MFCLFQPLNPGKGAKVEKMDQSESVLLPQSAALAASKEKGKTYPAVIVGAGPGGIAASIYLKRAGMEPLVFERDEIGGLLRNAHLIENYPGFPEGISGQELVELFRRQLVRWRIDMRMEEVHKVSRDGEVFKVAAETGDLYARSVIVATGTRPKRIEIEGLEDVELSRVFYEVRDIPLTGTGNFLIVGGGDTAFDYALNLAERGFYVDIVHRGQEPKCIPLLAERANRSERIRTHSDTEPKLVKEEDRQLVFAVDRKGAEKEMVADYGLIACGREAELGVLPPEFVDNWKEIPGLYVVGDARRGNYRQVGISVGDGILAAMSVIESLEAEE
ncbi:MAG: NAD(P)/FAD-dependent oxidoreductase [Thermoplasmata archaeon]